MRTISTDPYGRTGFCNDPAETTTWVLWFSVGRVKIWVMGDWRRPVLVERV